MIMDFLVGTNGCLTAGTISCTQTDTGLWNNNSSGTYTGTYYGLGGGAGVPETLNTTWTGLLRGFVELVGGRGGGAQFLRHAHFARP